MRILVVSNLYPPIVVGGYELRCQRVVAWLRRQGHTVEVLCSHAGLPAPADAADAGGAWRLLRLVGHQGFPWTRAPELFDLERHNLRSLRERVQAIDAEVVFAWNLGGIGKVLLVEADRLATLVSDISDHWPLRGIPGDPFLTWHRRHPLLGRMLPSARRDLPVVGIAEVPLGAAYFTSRSLRDLTAASGFAHLAGAPVIPCGIDLDRFTGEVRVHRDGVLACCYVGRLCADKGVRTACAAVQQAAEGITLDVYGDGDGDYVAALRRDFAHPRIRFHGPVSADAVPAIYRAHDCLVFPSEWPEPFALVPLEAAACGLAVVGTTTGGTGEFLVDGSTGLTYPAGEAAALADRLERLRQAPALAERLAATAQQVVRERYGEETMCRAIAGHLAAAASCH